MSTTGPVLFVLYFIMFSRTLTAAGFPALLNFSHLALSAYLIVLILFAVRSSKALEIFRVTLLFLAVIVISATLNGAGAINACLVFLIFGEPFILYVVIVARPWKPKSVRLFRNWLFVIAMVHMVFALIQYFALGYGGDDVKGLFLKQGAGHHVGGFVAMAAATYFFFDKTLRSVLLRVAVSAGLVVVAIVSDSKQMYAAFAISAAVVSVLAARSKAQLASSVLIVTLVWGVVFVALPYIVPAVESLVYDRVQEGVQHKLSLFPLIVASYESPLNWLFGIGPGHGTSRIAILIPQYSAMLTPLGATTSTVTATITQANDAAWFAARTSFWSLFYSWGAVWAELGLAGLIVYATLWLRVWRTACTDMVTKILVFAALILGLAFTWLQEPAFVTYLISLLGLNFQQQRLKATNAARIASSQRLGSLAHNDFNRSQVGTTNR